MAATPSSDAVARLADFLAIPSVSGEPAHRADMRRAAEWVAAELDFAGGRVVESDGHPVVLGESAYGVRVGCFRPPSVPDGVSRLRLTARANLTDDALAQVATALGAVAEQLQP